MRRARLLLFLGTSLLLGACVEPTGPLPLSSAPPTDSTRVAGSNTTTIGGPDLDFAVSW